MIEVKCVFLWNQSDVGCSSAVILIYTTDYTETYSLKWIPIYYKHSSHNLVSLPFQPVIKPGACGIEILYAFIITHHRVGVSTWINNISWNLRRVFRFVIFTSFSETIIIQNIIFKNNFKTWFKFQNWDLN